VIAAKGVCFKEAMTKEFKTYQRQVVRNVKVLAKELQKHGFKIVSGGTDNHLILIDLISKGITGKEAEEALGLAGITVNKNMIPFDQRTPMVTSGIRIGTPIVTTRGMRDKEMVQIASFIAEILNNHADPEVQTRVAQQAKELCQRFPFFQDRISKA
jgi:glycine hydroxymethyltransferase